MSNKEPQSSTSSTGIPIGGTLGILAHGYRGIMLWREARYNYAEELKSKQPKPSGE